MSINIYYIDHFYLEEDNIELGPFYFGINDVYGYFEKIMVINILILIIRFY